MKNFLKVILPVLAFTLASAAAVGTHQSKVEEANSPLVIEGFIQSPTENSCTPVSVNCTIENTGNACMTSDLTPQHVWLKDGANKCNVTLYRLD
ncbi:DUF6520 family protein [Flavobacterium soli]|uniref:DUF6520 family protein n=1 Tax=Flavobacterium soli TaxID=344881 RepID=UPI00047C2BA3